VSHFDEFSNITANLSCEAFFITETWLKPSLKSSLVDLPGYYLHRIGKGGGGVALYIRDDLPSKVIASSCPVYNSRPEFLFVEVSVFNEKVLLCVVYRLPKIGFLSDLENHFSTLLPNYRHVLIMGDFNANLIPNTPSDGSRQLRNILKSLGLSALPLKPTFHTSTSESLLDLIIVPDTNKVLNFGQVSIPGISNHDLLFISLQIKTPKPKPQFFRCRNFRTFNENDFIDDASLIPWSDITRYNTVNEKVLFFNNHLIQLYDRHANYKNIRVKHRPSPWMSNEVRSLMARRDCAYRRYKKNKSSIELQEAYKSLRNKTKQTIRNAKIRHAFSVFEVGDPKKIWSQVKEMGLGNSRNKENQLSVSLDDLNKHFVSCGIYDSTPDSTCPPPTLANRVIPPFHFKLVDSKEVYQCIRTAKPNSKGTDDIPLSLIKRPAFLSVIMPALLNIFNSSLLNGEFPECWKSALVRPLPKSTSPKGPADYRPISLLPALSKVLERLVHKQVSDHIAKYDLSDRYQSGFKKGHSTCTALLKVLDDARQAMDSKKVTLLILLDFSKAFNAVDFDILLSILSTFSFSDTPLAWFRSYLQGRTQLVSFKNQRSSPLHLQNGVPQGSVLGPLLFSLYINNLPQVLIHSKHHLFADDFQIYCHSSVKDLPLAVSRMNSDLEKINIWAKNHCLQINPIKTQAIIIGYPRLLSQIRPSNLPQLSLDTTPIKFVKKVKYLGITINERLTWTDQVNETCGRVFRALHSLRRLKASLPRTIRKLLVQSLILPYLDYCDAIYTDITDDLSSRLDRALNACIRFIFDLRKDDHVTEYYRALSWFRAKDRRHSHLLRLVHSLIRNRNPPYLSEGFQFLNNSSTRSELTLLTPLHRTTAYNKSFVVSGCRAWNALPVDIRRLDGERAFRQATIGYLTNR
jgi:Reverse transcriptase (RNA-dependent DNA polymerase)